MRPCSAPSLPIMSASRNPATAPDSDAFAASLEQSIDGMTFHNVKQDADTRPIPSSGSVTPLRDKKGRIPAEVWARIEVGYRAGVSATKLAHTHDVLPETIRVRAKKFGWNRDLARRIHEETVAKLAASAATDGADADELVDNAADLAAAVTQRHRTTTARLGRIIEAYCAKVEAILAPDTGEEAREAAAALLGARETVADVILKSANAISRLLPQERIANGIGSGDAPTTPFEDAIMALAKQGEEARRARNGA